VTHLTAAAAATDTPQDGFADKVFESTACFRAVLDAMSSPALPIALPVFPARPAGLSSTAVALLLTLADMDTPVWLGPGCDRPEARSYLRFHTGCPIAREPSEAAFAILPAAADPRALDGLPLGTAEYPDRSATVILLSGGLVAGAGPVFSGPGIDRPRAFDLADAHPDLWPRIARNQALFPRGLDWIFAGATDIAALPRSTEIGS